MNKKGITLIELLVSLALLSIVLIFLLNLFLIIRNKYNISSSQNKYRHVKNNVINALNSDSSKYKIKKIEKKSEEIVLTFINITNANTITKKLKIDKL